MVNTLPLAIQLKLDRTLAQWRHWRTERPLADLPQPLEVLSGGLSNYSIRVTAGSEYVVRIDGVDPRRLGLNRVAEYRALQLASRHRLAPTPRYFNPELGCLVCDYLPPADSQPGAAAAPPVQAPLAAVADLLRGIHRLPPLHHRLDLQARILRYERQWQQPRAAASPVLEACRGQVAELLQALESSPQAKVLCHNDLLRANRLQSAGRLWAIDWEYCAMGSPWFDLAVVVAGDQLNPSQQTTLLQAYLQRDPGPADRLTLHRHTCVYHYLELLWHAAGQSPVTDEDGLAKRLQRLQVCLQSDP
jgi:thiamine kinase-like enzyme